MIRMIKEPTKKVAFISSYTPRICGIATFTSDLINNIGLTDGEGFEPVVIAMESGVELEYDKPVELKIRKNVKYDYVSAADYINFTDVDIVSVQHEFGLFGGEGGSYLSLLLERVNKPVITTLHTILEKPSTEYFDSLTDVCMASDKVIVMNRRGYYKRILGMAGRKTILTFGLLNKNKGIEVMLRALPTIIKSDPSVLYIVLGVTHPEVLRHEGQSYKFKLDKTVKELGLQRNVVFHNRFVTDKKLFQYLGAADIYVTPYLHKEQLTSGTLAFAIGTGKAVVSTPYWAAQELLAEERGKLVGFGDSRDTARAIMDILRDSTLFSRMKRRAYEYGRSMTWPKIGDAYWNLFSSHVASIPILSKSSVSSPDWKMPTYRQQSMYQSA